MTTALFAIPGDLDALTGGYGYDRNVLTHLPEWGVAVRAVRLADGFPHPSREEIGEALRLLAQDPESVLLIDGLAYGVLPAADLAALRAPIVALVHHPLGLETGLDPLLSARLIESERAALAVAHHVIVTSDTTRDTLVADFGVPASEITVALPGTDPAPRAAGSQAGVLRILAVGSLVPRKGYEVLIEALSGLTHLPWHLSIVGSPDRAPSYAAALHHQVQDAGMAERVTLLGERSGDALETAYATSDLFVLSSHYEGYGMVLAEAMAHGLPIVTTTGGAAARTVPDAAGLKVPPGNAGALRDALAAAIAQPQHRQRLAEASWDAGRLLPTWSRTAQIVAEVIHNVVKDRT